MKNFSTLILVLLISQSFSALTDIASITKLAQSKPVSVTYKISSTTTTNGNSISTPISTTTTPIKSTSSQVPTNSGQGLPGGVHDGAAIDSCLVRIVEQAIFRIPQIVTFSSQTGFTSLQTQTTPDTGYTITYSAPNFFAILKARCINSATNVVIDFLSYEQF